MKKKITLLPLIGLIIFLQYNCSSNKDDYNILFQIEEETKTDISIFKVDIDSFHLEQIESSYIGDLYMSDDTIYFVDSRFCRIYTFDKTGVFLDGNLGQGGGPREINTSEIVGFTRLADKGWVFIGAGNDCHRFDKEFNKRDVFVINKQYKENMTYESPIKYSLCYPKLRIVPFEDYFIYNTYTEAPGLNFYDNKNEYFQKSRILTKVNYLSGKVVDHFGRFSPIYNNTKDDLRMFSLIDFDIDSKGNYYITYEADSLIYVYDKNYDIKRIFGYKGKEMQTNYNSLSAREFRNRQEDERRKSSYYTYVKYIEERNILLRTYTKNVNLNNGLQIYKGNTMIGDVDIPKDCKILGFSDPYIYMAPRINEDNETITIYKFKL